MSKESTVETADRLDEIRAKFGVTAAELGQALVDREDEINIVLNGLLAGEHVFFKGPPGEAKSLLLDAIGNWLHCRKFFVLLNGQSTLSDILGPVSLSALKNDQHCRNVKGKLPDAEIAFIDEPFRGNSAVRNCTLRIINEGHYEKGDGTFGKVPLKFLMAASNDYPKIEDEAEAYFDRFLYRKDVKTVVGSSLNRLLWSDHGTQLSTSLTIEELEEARAAALALPWSDEAKEAMLQIVHDLHKDGVFPSSRRLIKAKKACQAAAWLEGDSSVETEHLAILAHCLWVEPMEQPAKVGVVVLKYASPSTMKVNELLAQVEQVMSNLKPKDFVAAKAALAKLRDIERSLRKMNTSQKAQDAADKVKDKIKEVRETVSSVE